jgi:tripeptide aminopeptidase
LRDFDTATLDEHAALLETTANEVVKNYPGASVRFERKEQYRNMKEVLDQHPEVVAHAEQAIRRAGLSPEKGSIRGGTDGSRLSFMGLPCPNLFAGEQAIHSRIEWVSLQDMEKSVETVTHLCSIWYEKA